MKAFTWTIFFLLTIAALPGCVTIPNAFSPAATTPITQTDRIKLIQSNLTKAGYNPGPVDGVMGRKTESAISAYQRKHNLTVDGMPSEEVLTHLQSRYSDNTIQSPIDQNKPVQTAAERQLAAEAKRKYVAALTGCGIGGLTAVLFEKQNDKKLTKAAMGCALGGALGYAGGHYINARNRNYGEEQQKYRGMSAGAQADIERYQQTIIQAQEINATYAARIKKLNAEYRAGSITANQYRGQISRGNESLKNLQTLNRQLEANIDTIEKDINAINSQGRNTQELQQRVATLRQQNLQLETEIAAFSETLSEVPAEVTT
jgi:peptidoglycan hydrolase-like protein with peptidoglycan-binding domain